MKIKQSSGKFRIYFELFIFVIDPRFKVKFKRELDFLALIFRYLEANLVVIGNQDYGTYHLKAGKFINCCADSDEYVNYSEPICEHHLWRGYIEGSVENLKCFVRRIGAYRAEDPAFGIRWRFDEKQPQDLKEIFNINELDLNKLTESLEIKSFGLGNMINGNRFVSHFKSESSRKVSDIKMNFDHLMRMLKVQFGLVNADKRTTQFSLEYNYASIKDVTISQKIGCTSAFFNLSYPPKIFINNNQNSQKNNWTRWTDCGIINQDVIGMTNVLQVRIDTSLNFDSLSSLFSTVQSFYHYNGRKNIFSFAPIDELTADPQHHLPSTLLPFSVSYALACVTSLSYTFQDDLGHNFEKADFEHFIKDLIKRGKANLVVLALYRLADEFKTGQVYNSFQHFIHFLDKVDENSNLIGTSDGNDFLKYTREAIMTPTKVIYRQPSPCRTSFFLKDADSDFVLRVMIRDEDHGSIHLLKASSEEDQKYFFNKLVSDRLIPSGGLLLCGRSYQYYGCSSSQLKEAGMMLYAKDFQGRTAQLMRSCFGLVKERTVSKQIARVGLSLSQLMAHFDLPPDTKIYFTPDVYGGPESGERYNFTDGCGFCSRSMANYSIEKLSSRKLIRKSSDEDGQTTEHSAFQIRFCGSKGMLVVDQKLTGNCIVLRDSMMKMFGKKGDLGIVKLNEPRMAYLNKPFITVLNQIGLSNQYFIDLTFETVSQLRQCFNDNSAAVKALKSYSSINRFIDIDSLARVGYKLNGDPLFGNILSFVHHSALEIIKSKARIALPMDKARTMFGVTDPTVKYPKSQLEFDSDGYAVIPKLQSSDSCLGTGVLKDGEVFAWPSDFSSPLEGDIIVTKFPVANSGDIRRLTAVNRPELHHIKDCIVFPVAGTRPIPDQMAGSDLDGDEYCVIWLQDFLKIDINEPAIFPSFENSVMCEQNFTDKMCIDFFTDYQRKCAVGPISNALLSRADKEGINSEKCKELANKLAFELDSGKHGCSSEFSFNTRDRSQEIPSFMEKDGITLTYLSDKALEDIVSYTELTQLFSCETETNFELDKRLIHPNWKSFAKAALEAHTEYEETLKVLLQRLGYASENELLTLIDSQDYSRRNRGSDRIDTVVSIVYETLVKKADRRFNINCKSMDQKMACASAYYIVTHVKSKTSGYRGLPFIGDCAKYLIKLMENNNSATNNALTHKRSNVFGKAMLGWNDKGIKYITARMVSKLEMWLRLFPGRQNKRLKIDVRKLELILNNFRYGHTNIFETFKKLNPYTKHLVEENALDQGIFDLPSGSENMLVRLLFALFNHEARMLHEESFVIKDFWVKSSNRVDELLKTLKQMIIPAQIGKSCRKNSDIRITIRGSPATIIVAKIVIRMYNRLTPIITRVGYTNGHHRHPLCYESSATGN